MPTTTKKTTTKKTAKAVAPVKKTAKAAAPVKKTAAKESSYEFKGQYHYANGKRKTSVARVRLYQGKGNIIVNDAPVEEYFFGTLVGNVLAPLKLVEMSKNFDASVKVEGGGISSQADAVRHGLSKDLVEFDPALRAALKKEGFMTRDSRSKERKKFGLKRARRAPQWSKR